MGCDHYGWRVSNNEIILTALPRSYTLKDGRTVSNYKKLPKDVLLFEGWLPVEQVKDRDPEEGEMLIVDRLEILEDKILEYYKVIIAEPEI